MCSCSRPEAASPCCCWTTRADDSSHARRSMCWHSPLAASHASAKGPPPLGQARRAVCGRHQQPAGAHRRIADRDIGSQQFSAHQRPSAPISAHQRPLPAGRDIAICVSALRVVFRWCPARPGTRAARQSANPLITRPGVLRRQLLGLCASVLCVPAHRPPTHPLYHSALYIWQ